MSRSQLKEQSSKKLENKKQIQSVDYSDWEAGPSDLKMDKIFDTIKAVMILIPTTLGALYIWHIV